MNQQTPLDDVPADDDLELLSVIIENVGHPLSKALLSQARQALQRIGEKARVAERATGEGPKATVGVGNYVRIVRGRKLPHGSLWRVEWKGPTEFGYSLRLRSIYGELAFTAYKNVHGAVATPDEEALASFMLDLVRQRHLNLAIPPFPRSRNFHAYVSCRFCRQEVSTSTSGSYNHLKGCKEIPKTLLPVTLRHSRRGS